MRPFFIFLFSLSLLLSFTGCASLNRRDSQLSQVLEPQINMKFGDIPVPAGFRLVGSDSYVFESSGIRVGVLKYRGKANIDQVVNFYKEQMTMNSWNLLNVVEYDQHLLNFDRDNEMCTINMKANGNSITMTIFLGPKSQWPSRKAKEKEPMK